MKRTRRGLLLLALLVVGMLVQAAPASAHGVCKTTASPPVRTAVGVFISGAYECSENHANLYVDVCLQKSLSPTLTGWEYVFPCHSAHAAGGNHVHAFGFVNDTPCLVGYYRTIASGQNGSGAHRQIDVSPPVACASAAL